MRPNKICIILLNWNGKKDTLECLESLSKVTYPRFTTVVVDNGSIDQSVAAIRETFPETPILETGANLGFSGGNNVGIQWALTKPFEWILLLNNDTVVDPHFLDAFLKTASEYPNAKIFGAKIFRYSEPSLIDHLGGRWNESHARFESIGLGLSEQQIHTTTSEIVDYVCGACLFMHRSVPETIGLLEAKFFLFWEETDYCFRAQRKGFEVRTAPNAKIWHKISASFIGGKPHSHYFWWRSRLLWMQRNLHPNERKKIDPIVRREFFKMVRHFLIRSMLYFFGRIFLLPQKPHHILKLRNYRAGIMGAIHYFLGKFGNCPKWIAKS